MRDSERMEAGFLLRKLQEGEILSMPESRPMPSIGKVCHELRIKDENKDWRLIYFIDSDAIAILAVEEKRTRTTPQATIDVCQGRLKRYKENKERREKDEKREEKGKKSR
jgi:phage-related protein